jgi:hypothetical protein
MTRWIPWLAVFVLWNGTFDLQVRRAAEAFTAEQVAQWREGRAPALVSDAFTPRVRNAAWRSTALTGVAALAALIAARRLGRRADR